METDDQEVEELKRWWNENGKTVVAGLVLGLGGVFGWTTWQGYSQTRAEHSRERSGIKPVSSTITRSKLDECPAVRSLDRTSKLPVPDSITPG